MWWYVGGYAAKFNVRDCILYIAQLTSMQVRLPGASGCDDQLKPFAEPSALLVGHMQEYVGALDPSGQYDSTGQAVGEEAA